MIVDRSKRTGKPAGLLCAILALVLPFAGCSGGNEKGIILAGSTSVQPYAEVLAEEYAFLCPGSDVDIQGGGSAAGITAAQNGTADIGMSSRDLKDSESELWRVEIAKDGLAVIVNNDNPISDMTLEQIRAVYSGTITNWSELGGIDHKIHIIGREEGSGTRSAFESLVMLDERISPKAIVQDSNGAVRLLVSGDKNSIGFISLGLVDDTVKAVRLDGVVPARENIVNDTYKLYRSFLFVTRDEPTGLCKDFIDFTLSPEGQDLLAREGLIPVVHTDDEQGGEVHE